VRSVAKEPSRVRTD